MTNPLAQKPVSAEKAANRPPNKPVAQSNCPPSTPIKSWPTLADKTLPLLWSDSQAALNHKRKPPRNPAKKAPQLFLGINHPTRAAKGASHHHGKPRRQRLPKTKIRSAANKVFFIILNVDFDWRLFGGKYLFAQKTRSSFLGRF